MWYTIPESLPEKQYEDLIYKVYDVPKRARYQHTDFEARADGNRSKFDSKFGQQVKIDFFFPPTVGRLLLIFVLLTDNRRTNAPPRAPHRGASGNTWTDVGCANICPRCCFFSFSAAERLPMVQLRTRSSKLCFPFEASLFGGAVDARALE